MLLLMAKSGSGASSFRSLYTAISCSCCFPQVVDLQKLTLSHNVISVLDEKLGSLVTLTLLDLSHNQLRSLPATVGR